MPATNLILNRTGLDANSRLLHLKCPECGLIHDAAVVNTVCTNNSCQSTLFAEYELPRNLSKDMLLGRPATMWRYKEFLPIINEENIITLGEGFTPILPLQNLKHLTGNTTVYWKDESGNPTGSFKARGISMAVSKAK